jgi:hypothetical protein
VIGTCASSAILGRLLAALFWLELALGSFKALVGSNVDRTRGAHSNGSSDLVVLLKRSCHGAKVLSQGQVQHFGLHTAAFVLERHRHSLSIVRFRLENQFLHKAFNRFHWQSLVGKKSPKVTGVAKIAHGTFLSLELLQSTRIGRAVVHNVTAPKDGAIIVELLASATKDDGFLECQEGIDIAKNVGMSFKKQGRLLSWSSALLLTSRWRDVIGVVCGRK